MAEAGYKYECHKCKFPYIYSVIISLLFFPFFFYSLRSPKAPDDQADMGSHEFSYAVFPHSGKQTTLNFLLVYLFVSFDQLK